MFLVWFLNIVLKNDHYEKEIEIKEFSFYLLFKIYLLFFFGKKLILNY